MGKMIAKKVAQKLAQQQSFDKDFERADKVVHPVENEWHYPIMTKGGFHPTTKSGVGFVRSYNYENPLGHKITVTTGVSGDYWDDHTVGGHGYWSELEPHLEFVNEFPTRKPTRKWTVV